MKKRTGIHLLLTSFLSLTLPSGTLLASEQEPAPLTFDNLVPVEGGRMQSSFLDPQADFSVFRRVAILNPAIAFRSNWQRDQNRSRSRNVSRRDMERIKEAAARLFQQVFSERLEAAGYTASNPKTLQTVMECECRGFASNEFMMFSLTGNMNMIRIKKEENYL